MMTTAPLPPTRLAALDVDIPDGGYTLHSFRQHQTRSGSYLYARVKRRGVLVGEIENQGNGGGSWFRPTAPGAHQDFQVYVQAFADWHIVHNGIDYGRYDHEAVCDLLLDNAARAAELTRDSRTGTVFLLDEQDPREGHNKVRITDVAAARTWLHTTYPGQRVRLWDRGAKRWVDA